MSNSPPTRVCADSSLIVKLGIPEDGSAHAEKKWRDWTISGVEIVAPHLLKFEITSVVRKRTRRGDVRTDRARSVLEFFLGLPISFVAFDGMHLEALRIAEELDQPAAYDAHYLAVSGYFNCPLWTADGRLQAAAAAVGVDAFLLADS